MNLGRGAIAAYFFFNIFFSFAYTECIQTNTRAKGGPVRVELGGFADATRAGMAAYAFTVSAVGFINTYAGPIGLQNITENYIWVFVGWDCIEAAIWYFFCVETQGRTLEASGPNSRSRTGTHETDAWVVNAAGAGRDLRGP
ncbi:hypothetical protein RQP46_001598 [Phenoliferia psychrophenolica]